MSTSVVAQLVNFLAQDPLTIEDVASYVGSTRNDPGAPLAIELIPTIAGVQTARMWRYPDNGLTYLLELEFADDAAPRLSELRTLMGNYKRLRSDIGMPARVVFHPSAAGSRWAIAVIAELSPDTGAIGDQTVTRLAFRRDPVSN